MFHVKHLDGTMRVVAVEDIWVVLASNGDQIAGPFSTQAEAWRWVDRNDQQDNAATETYVRIRQAYATR